MSYLLRNLLLCLLASGTSVGCGLNTAVIKTGGSGLQGALLNYSCGAHPCDAIDPTKPTIVITNGWNPLPNLIHTSFASAGAEAIKRRCGNSYNILNWDWNAVRVFPVPGPLIHVGREQGHMLALALRDRGTDPSRTHMIAHSLGTIAVAQAAVCLCDRGPTAQLTFLDPPKMFHKELFENLAATRHACVVENYWSPGVSGLGAKAPYQGVRNYLVEGTHPIRGVLDPSISNHVDVMRWYHRSMTNPAIPYGFQKSTLLGYCGTQIPFCHPRHGTVTLQLQ